MGNMVKFMKESHSTMDVSSHTPGSDVGEALAEEGKVDETGATPVHEPNDVGTAEQPG